MWCYLVLCLLLTLTPSIKPRSHRTIFVGAFPERQGEGTTVTAHTMRKIENTGVALAVQYFVQLKTFEAVGETISGDRAYPAFPQHLLNGNER